MRPAYGVSAGPVIVAVQAKRLFGSSGKAETPGVDDIMSCISSVWRLPKEVSNNNRSHTLVNHYRLVTLWVSLRRVVEDSFAAS